MRLFSDTTGYPEGPVDGEMPLGPIPQYWNRGAIRYYPQDLTWHWTPNHPLVTPPLPPPDLGEEE